MHWIKQQVTTLMDTYDTNDPFELCELLGIYITVEYLRECEGYYYNHYSNQIIGVNSTLDYYDQRVVTAHELGHALLHPDLNFIFLSDTTFMTKDKLEHQANIFVAHLLLPDNFIFDFPNMTIDQIAQMTALPSRVVELKARITEEEMDSK